MFERRYEMPWRSTLGTSLPRRARAASNDFAGSGGRSIACEWMKREFFMMCRKGSSKFWRSFRRHKLHRGWNNGRNPNEKGGPIRSKGLPVEISADRGE